MNCVIFSGGIMQDGSWPYNYINDADFIICADSGAKHAVKLGIKPEYIIGDFDSIDNETLEYIKKTNVKIIEYPCNKNKTDTDLCIEYAAKKGADKITVLGGLGGRNDHLIANIMLLTGMIKNGIKGIIADEKNEITITDSDIVIYKNDKEYLSLIPVAGKAEGVTTKYLAYPLKDAVLCQGTTWGISNRFTGKKAKVSLKSGLLLVIASKD